MVSIIIPAYNEVGTVAKVLAEIIGHPKVREIIVVDDGSTDGTADVVRAFAAENGDSNVSVIQLEKMAARPMLWKWAFRLPYRMSFYFLMPMYTDSRRKNCRRSWIPCWIFDMRCS